MDRQRARRRSKRWWRVCFLENLEEKGPCKKDALVQCEQRKRVEEQQLLLVRKKAREKEEEDQHKE